MDKNIGKKLDGRYDIQEIIGVGGMAVVYKAYDSIEDRVVAVKILKEEFLSNEEFRRRFKNESKAIAVLSHPNIVKVFDVSFSESMQYIVMEYINGITLKEYIDQQKVLPWKEAVHFTVQILLALRHAHDRGIVHRDIKPQNIMLLPDGAIKVTDFGIARFAQSETRTMTEKAIGSVHYISPEQARGEATDDKTDIYSVGVMLYEMLTGRLPFEADSAVSVAIMQMQTAPVRPREINDSIPEGLEEITLRAMQKDPSQRYQSAAEMLEDIDRFKENPSIRFEYKYFVDDNPTKYVDSINEIRDTDDEQTVSKKKKKTSLIPILSGVAAAVLLAVVLGVIGILASNGLIGNSSGQIQVPNLVGKSYNDVVAKYTNINIIKQNTEYSTKYAAGVIISQDLSPTIKMKVHGTLNVTVSLGAVTKAVTDVYGQEASQAQSMLTSDGFTNTVVVKQYSTTTASGFVINTDPVRGSVIPQSQKITVYVSQGPAPVVVTVPKVVGMSLDDAKNKIQGSGLAVGTVTNVANNAASGTVLSQTPTDGTTVSAGQTINLTVSQGPTDFSTTISLPISNSSYTITAQVDGRGFSQNNVLPFTTVGGSAIAFDIPGGNFTGTHDVQIFVSDGDSQYQNKLYKEITVNFDTGKIVSVVKDNHSSFTQSAASSTPPVSSSEYESSSSTESSSIAVIY